MRQDEIPRSPSSFFFPSCLTELTWRSAQDETQRFTLKVFQFPTSGNTASDLNFHKVLPDSDGSKTFWRMERRMLLGRRKRQEKSSRTLHMSSGTIRKPNQ